MSPDFCTLCRQHFGWLLIASFAVVATFLTACQTSTVRLSDTPQIPGATFVGNNACFDCHTNISRAFAGSPHSRLYVSDHSMKGQAGCEACHGPGSKHIQAGGGKGVFIVNPGTEAGTCFTCHQETHAQFRLPHHHPVVEGDLNCVQCHDPHGMDIHKPASGLAFSRQDQSCAKCHSDQSRPFVFVHEALREGCTTCHQPHGSINEKMLVARDNNLCLRCHAQIANPNAATGSIGIGGQNHTAFLSRGTCWSSGCHTSVHGSNVDPKLRY